MEEKTIVALEIGSSKIKGAIGSVDPSSGALSVKAVEEERISDIVRYGCIRNVVETAAAVRNVVNRLEQREAPRKIERVYLSIGGRSLSSECVDIERRFPTETEITAEVIKDITEEALNRPLSDRIVVKALPRELRVDNAPTPRAVGMYGQQMTARLNLVSGRNQLVKSLTQVIEGRMGLEIVDVAVRPLAEADLVLMSDERRLGCMLVDLGAETTSVAIYKDGVLVHLAVLPMGSRNITRDITALNYLEERAEELKIAFGNAMPGAEQHSLRPADSTDMTAVNNYISARAGEILLNVVEQIKYAGLTPDRLPGGVILVGRGARLAGLSARLEQMLPNMKVRVGLPDNNVHILDGRIQSSDAVDVIAILSDAARNEPKECLSPQPTISRQPQPQPQTGYQTGYQSQQGNTYQAPQQPAYQPQQPAQQPYQHPYQPNNRPIENTPYTSVAHTPQVTPTPATGQRPTPVSVGTTVQQPAPQQTRKPSAFGTFMERIKTKVANVLTENMYEESEEE